MRTISRLGTIFLLVGSLILLAVILIWLVAPRMEPTPFAEIENPTLLSQTNSIPALSPFAPPSPVHTKALLSTLGTELTSTASSSHSISQNPSSGNWNVISYVESRALGAHDRELSNPTLRLSIPALEIDAPVIPVSSQNKQNRSGRRYKQWSVPNLYAVGWHDSSAPPGQIGNIVLNGHNNIHGAIFADLVDLTLGEQIILYEVDRQHIYEVVHREFLPETGEPLRTRLRNARWIAPSNDARLTLVTCWPNSSNSHRLVVVALPLSKPGL